MKSFILGFGKCKSDCLFVIKYYYFKNPNEIKLQFHYAMKSRSRIQDKDARLLTMKTQIKNMRFERCSQIVGYEPEISQCGSIQTLSPMWFQTLGVTTATYLILVNGEPKGLIHPSRGIRQRYPLSPFLFLLCTKGLHGLIRRAATEGRIKGFSLCKRGPKLTHLFFVDDSLLFCRATSNECNVILDLLGSYERVLG